MQTVTSTDGTRIAYEEHGTGHPLVLLHGGSATRHSWGPLIPHLAAEFRLIVPDRRGRGESGDGDDYSLAREVQDLRSLVDNIEGDVSVFGHSFGGLVALAAAAETDIQRLILYEPALLVGDHRGDNLAARMREQVAAGDREEAMKLFYREGAGIPDPEALPIWPAKFDFDLVDTVIRENAAVEGYELPSEVDIVAPTLLLTGDRGPPHLGDAVRTLDDQLSESRLVELDGVGHIGTQTAPERVATEIRSFLQEPIPQA
ncbi:pimeloyl-ACP methyl ester carboxylesterase [Halohasta litchfieldiae]|jgi:pimeloyl-ACP methyl ester carboxylesterase|uniref:Pimeloyl-ACP methyl ester carboxylesterase n=1 Tax=Halohasta litchfieldiae TaxID=1073996 RepID=A0A1H6XGG4_9EURY|nr:alpha/beta hydrolase [Halohasta litchfieldiae]ATW89019.1 pimeloyl-ACP methyl ester carboxylesterase [Halohasta litchfieldiae]SEJ28208.1 Pimeloyl-ACP methyl ester carboxylesterase [Halohasta litchfieldiae]